MCHRSSAGTCIRKRPSARPNRRTFDRSRRRYSISGGGGGGGGGGGAGGTGVVPGGGGVEPGGGTGGGTGIPVSICAHDDRSNSENSSAFCWADSSVAVPQRIGNGTAAFVPPPIEVWMSV